ncbi:RNA cytidine acetyltransferase [Schistosoma japonicum]|nr:RNA cytidine acetyltransferase [Schistosoma japonicum]KAH8851297.1 RNA cytidine acetyltransferase [Schistosoma japonicum]
MGRMHKLDNRIQIMLKNGILQKHRSMFVMVGDKGQDQVPIMHQILSSLSNKGQLSVLWCYKKELSFSTHRKKNLKLLNKRRKAGLTSDATVFEQFVCSTDIRWCYYDESQKILGQTFDMCILQDFEALTPNLLARTIETVSGGGLIVLLLKTMTSLHQLCTLVMDVHSRYRTESRHDVIGRFNERFLLSLASNSRCLVLDDQWNVLPLSRKILSSLTPLPADISDKSSLVEQKELQKLKISLAEDGSPFAPLIKLCVTFDQAKSLVQFCASLTFASKLQNKGCNPNPHDSVSLSTTASLLSSVGPGSNGTSCSSALVVVTAGRGRGKSAALGLGLAAAFETGMPNLYVTAPSPENLNTLMQFVINGLNALQYTEHQDYIVSRSICPEHNQAIVRIDAYRQNHRQSLIYLPPWEMAALSSVKQADLICIDEAAAIPLPLVQSIINGPRFVFMASTVNGYEGTGRSLSFKLLRQLRCQCTLSGTTAKLSTDDAKFQSTGKNQILLGKGFRSVDTSRVLYEISLTEAIRYANGDPIEAWLFHLLCLDCGESLFRGHINEVDIYLPPVDQCQLYYVNRDTLFSYHKSTEIFLHRLMALYVSSHYKNSPNDLQLLSDAPAHHIFCLLAPYDPKSGCVPEILCVLQVSLEGKINKDRIIHNLSRGLRPSGDLIPWTLSQQFCDPNFGELSGARVVRIATHPDYQSLGYGTRALKLLYDYYNERTDLKVPSQSQCTDIQIERITCKDSTKKTKIINETLNKSLEPNPSTLNFICDLDEIDDNDQNESFTSLQSNNMILSENNSKLLTETIKRREPASLPPLLSRLNERPCEKLDYIGVSFGATPSLLRFWKRSGYVPVYLRQNMNELTGEFTCIMLKPLMHQTVSSQPAEWLRNYFHDFAKRLIHLFPGPFRHMDGTYGLELLSHKSMEYGTSNELTHSEIKDLFTTVDLERLRRYSRSLVDFHLVNDLIPRLAQIYFQKRMPNVRLNKTQQVILLCMGLQHKTVEQISIEFTRLLGDSARPQIRVSDISRSDDAVYSILNSLKEKSDLSPSIFNTDSVGRKKKGPDTGVNSGWTKCILGLLFVIVREHIKSLDAIVESEKSCKIEPKKDTVSGYVHPVIDADFKDGSYTALTIDENTVSESDDDISEECGNSLSCDDSDGIPEDKKHDYTHNLKLNSEISDSERERRSTLVRQLISEEITGQSNLLSAYKIQGSETDWAEAVVGHGSDLSSLTVKLSSNKKTNDKR